MSEDKTIATKHFEKRCATFDKAIDNIFHAAEDLFALYPDGNNTITITRSGNKVSIHLPNADTKSHEGGIQ